MHQQLDGLPPGQRQRTAAESMCCEALTLTQQAAWSTLTLSPSTWRPQSHVLEHRQVLGPEHPEHQQLGCGVGSGSTLIPPWIVMFMFSRQQRAVQAVDAVN